MIESPDFYIKTGNEMAAQFNDIPEAISNSVKIADMCDFEIQLGKWILPKYTVPEGKTTAQLLREKVYEGLPLRYEKITDIIEKRVDYELSIITKKGYETYFLIVADFVTWA